MTPGLRILHTADLHIGRTLYTRSLKDDQQYILSQIVDIAEREKVDMVVVAGDLFDRSVPSAEAIQLAGSFLADIRERCACPIIVIAGNHDSPERLDFLSEFLSRQGLHIRGRLDPSALPIRYSTDSTIVTFYPVPYAEPLTVSYALGLEPLSDHQSAWDALIPVILGKSGGALQRESDTVENQKTEEAGKTVPVSPAVELNVNPKDTAGLKRGARNKGDTEQKQVRILIGHCYAAGGTASESERPLSIGGSELVSTETFKDFDIVMLGHLHRPQKLGRNIRYSGSPIALGAAEAEQVKQVLLYDIDTKLAGDGLWQDEAISVRAIELHPRKQLVLLEGSFEELSDRVCQDYAIAKLTDKLPVFDAFSRLQKNIPFLLHIEYTEVSGTQGNEADIGKRREALEAGEAAIVASFVQDMTGQAMDPAETEIVEQVLRQLEQERRKGDAATQT